MASRISRHQKLLLANGWTKLNRKSPHYPVGGPHGPGTAIFEKLPEHQVGLYADGSWDHASDFDGTKVTSGDDYASLEKDIKVKKG